MQTVSNLLGCPRQVDCLLNEREKPRRVEVVGWAHTTVA